MVKAFPALVVGTNQENRKHHGWSSTPAHAVFLVPTQPLATRKHPPAPVFDGRAHFISSLRNGGKWPCRAGSASCIPHTSRHFGVREGEQKQAHRKDRACPQIAAPIC